jgi:class 3 adenylate cyclase
MKCFRCRADNLAGMKFCGECGRHSRAPDSTIPLRSNRTPPDRPQLGAKRHPLRRDAVAFCDIVGSTTLTERLGAEAVRDLVSSFLNTSLAEVDRYRGAAMQFTGDGFVAVFGAPVTQEDHLRRALLAAVAIQQALSGRVDSADHRAMDLPLRMGIHTGPVVFGPTAKVCEWMPLRSATWRMSPLGYRRRPNREPSC